ncbi:hypothetical protein ACFPES_29770 [Paenibacillus sp. GCM10023248]|uniref:hypothetical protein n=1 Tax=Bacillales TaxID=1385 RepID=UPI0023793272|nr:MULTISPECIES: hypothetical protein [Bacillales]MDD9271230.1 hypothetical protein [Paenibacillus sp. MAHUQ-63]MDR6881649.1 hypothetical protein [Bacillus sp. 3255]
MLDFTFEIMDEYTINTRILYANEWFTFNLYEKDHVWTLHPFDGMLIRNKDMCELVMNELLKNKYFHVMCAKENIILSEIRTTVDVGRRSGNPEPIPVPSSSRRERPPQNELPDDIQAFMDYHDLEDILEIEKEFVHKRLTFYKQMLEIMFMQGGGPDDREFREIQSLFTMYKEMLERLNGWNDRDSSGNNRRW